MNIIRTITVFLLVTGFGAAALAQIENYTPVTNDMVLNPNPEDWIMWRRTIDNQGFSPLDQITTGNVADLNLEWAWAMPEGGLQELSPLVHDGIMFLGINRAVVQALDAVSGELLWEYRQTLPEFEGGYHDRQADRQKNTIALYEDKVYLTTPDAKIVALEARTGQVIWEQQVHDWEKGYSYTAGPLVVDGKVFTGISGCSMTDTAGGCYITAHDAETGEELWRINTLSDPENPEVEASWGGLPVENRWGGSPWTTGSYDPELDMIFWGVGMPIPYPEVIRGSDGGNVLYTNSTLAIDADTGEVVWYYQHLPRDDWDLDSPFERVLIDTAVAPDAGEVAWSSPDVTPGQEYKVIVTVPGKYGTAFVLDRATGKLLWARDTAHQNVISGYTDEGEVIPNAELVATSLDDTVMVCGGRSLGKLWMAGAYSPQTNAFYAPVAESCVELTPEIEEFRPGESVGSQSSGDLMPAPGEDTVGRMYAFDVSTGEMLWVRKQETNFTSSALTTGGGILFAGDGAREFMAMDQETGRTLWSVKLNTTIAGHPMTYMVDGKQYVAVPTGPNAQSSSAQPLFFPDTPVVANGNSLFIFALPDAQQQASQ